MKMKQEGALHHEAEAPASVGAKRPYMKPMFSHESVFETMALACGKMRGQGTDNCRRSAANS